MINRAPRSEVTYVQIHWKKTLKRKLLSRQELDVD